MTNRVRELIAQGVKTTTAFAVAAEELGESSHALRLKYYKSTLPRIKSHGHSLLTVEQNRIILHLAIGFSASHVGWNRKLFKFGLKTLVGFEPERRIGSASTPST